MLPAWIRWRRSGGAAAWRPAPGCSTSACPADHWNGPYATTGSFVPTRAHAGRRTRRARRRRTVGRRGRLCQCGRPPRHPAGHPTRHRPPAAAELAGDRRRRPPVAVHRTRGAPGIRDGACPALPGATRSAGRCRWRPPDGSRARRPDPCRRPTAGAGDPVGADARRRPRGVPAGVDAPCRPGRRGCPSDRAAGRTPRRRPGRPAGRRLAGDRGRRVRPSQRSSGVPTGPSAPGRPGPTGPRHPPVQLGGRPRAARRCRGDRPHRARPASAARLPAGGRPACPAQTANTRPIALRVRRTSSAVAAGHQARKGGGGRIGR